MKRAAGAKGGLYGNAAAEATYPFTKTLADGEALDDSKSNYTLTFPAGQYPPVNAFWSVTMYDGKTQLLIKNPINRYLINSPMLPDLKKNADGSLTLYIQNRSPGSDKEPNWLPTPDGPIYLAMRLYWPKTEPPSVLPPGEGTPGSPPALSAPRNSRAFPAILPVKSIGDTGTPRSFSGGRCECGRLDRVPGKGWFTTLRLYSSLEPFFTKEWRPNEIELVK